MSLPRLLLSGLALVLLGGPALILARVALWVEPRETCRWRDEDFCSDYGPLYSTLAILFALALTLALWAINRKRRGS